MRGKKRVWALLFVLVSMGLVSCGKQAEKSEEKPKDAPDTWIADRKMTGLIFMSGGDAETKLNPEVMAEIKKRTGIELTLESSSASSSIEGLTAGLAAGDLPDFVAYYLNHSGRPEMPVLLKAAREGMFTDLTPLLKETTIYSKYFEEGYLPRDTKDNIMFPKEFNGKSYVVHMEIPRYPGTVKKKYVGGMFILQELVDQLGIKPEEITTSAQVHQLLQDIKALGLKDSNGREITPLGPTIWGGSERNTVYNDLAWGSSDEHFLENEAGKLTHESQTDYPEKRIAYVRELLAEGLMHKEFYTMEENKATEGIINKSFGVIADIHNYMPQNNDLKYVPLGPLNTPKGPYRMELAYKSGYNGWSIPATTKNPEDIVKFADFLASREGKLLTTYGIEGRDYELDKAGNPIIKEEVKQLLNEKPEEAKKLGFGGVGNRWAEILGNTDIAFEEDFGETEWGAKEEEASAAQKLIEMSHFDEKFAQAEVLDGLSPKTYLSEWDKDGKLKIAFDSYNDNILRAYYAKNEDEVKKILKETRELLKNANLEDYIAYVEKKVNDENLVLRY